MRFWARTLVVLLFVTVPAAAQYYPIGGKNKIRYDEFKWYTYSTPHFKISYYDRVEPKLEKIASFAESSYDDETYRRRRYAGAIKRLDNETEKRLIAKRLSRQIDRATAATRNLDLAAGNSHQRRIDYPAIDLRHQLISFGRAQKLSGIGNSTLTIR